MNDFKIVELEQNTSDWHDWRATVIGASEGRDAMNINKRLWLIKTGQIERPFFSTAATRRGHALEPEARFMAEVELGMSFIPLCAQRGFIAASADGVNLDEKSGVEIKCPSNPEIHEEHLRGNISRVYLHQMQQQMYVFGFYHMSFISYMPEHETTHKIISIERDDDYIAEMIVGQTEFWKRVQSGVWPNDGLADLILQAAEATAVENEAAEAAKLAKTELRNAMEDAGVKSSDADGIKVCMVSRKIVDRKLLAGDDQFEPAKKELDEAKAKMKEIEDKYKLASTTSMRLTLPKA